MTGKEVKDWAMTLSDDDEIDVVDGKTGESLLEYRNAIVSIDPAGEHGRRYKVTVFVDSRTGGSPQDGRVSLTGLPDSMVSTATGMLSPDEEVMMRTWRNTYPGKWLEPVYRALFYKRQLESLTGMKLLPRSMRQPYPVMRFLIYRELYSDGIGFDQMAAPFGMTGSTARKAVKRYSCLSEYLDKELGIGGMKLSELEFELDRRRRLYVSGGRQ